MTKNSPGPIAGTRWLSPLEGGSLCRYTGIHIHHFNMHGRRCFTEWPGDPRLEGADAKFGVAELDRKLGDNVSGGRHT